MPNTTPLRSRMPRSTSTPEDSAFTLRLCALILFAYLVILAAYADPFVAVSIAVAWPTSYVFLAVADVVERGRRSR